jgi:hypothetical protein
MRWRLDTCENAMRQRRKLRPFPEFVHHAPRHQWDAAQKSSVSAVASEVLPASLKIGKGLIKAPNDTVESLAGEF